MRVLTFIVSACSILFGTALLLGSRDPGVVTVGFVPGGAALIAIGAGGAIYLAIRSTRSLGNPAVVESGSKAGLFFCWLLTLSCLGLSGLSVVGAFEGGHTSSAMSFGAALLAGIALWSSTRAFD